MNELHCIPKASGPATGEVPASDALAVASASGPWTVEVVGPSGFERRTTLRPGQRLTIGSRGDVDIAVSDPCVSGRHCLLDASREELAIIDLGSKNGVYVGGVRIESAKLAAAPATFTVGHTRVLVRTLREASAKDRYAIEGLDGQSEPMTRLKRDIHRYAKLRAPVLIVGETGVGKDVVARSLHLLSGRDGAYVPINVATIPETLADSELFGHQKGAFTGALQARAGAFEQAHRGTLFLDEIGELTPVVQAKMLRILEDGIVRPIGASTERRVDVRVVSATWASLAERCVASRFRFDLFQRLSVVVIEVPPLRERRSDVPLLAEAWLKRHQAELGAKVLSARAIQRLCEYDWPGNVRELGGALYRAGVMTETDCIDDDAIGRALSNKQVRSSRSSSSPLDFLVRADGNVSEAARLAGLPRTTFRNWLRRVRAA